MGDIRTEDDLIDEEDEEDIEKPFLNRNYLFKPPNPKQVLLGPKLKKSNNFL